MDTTPLSAQLGGLLIGSSTALFLILNGRIAEISGIVGGLFPASRGDTNWRLAFLAGLLGAPLVYTALGGTLPPVRLNAPVWLLVLGGLLAGFGTRLGAGCTSGHGVCGIGRGSRRSIVATFVFTTTAILTVFVIRHLVGL